MPRTKFEVELQPIMVDDEIYEIPDPVARLIKKLHAKVVELEHTKTVIANLVETSEGHYEA